MSLLVDTSAWSLMLRRKYANDHAASLFLQSQIQDQNPVYLNGIIFQEILQAIRSLSQFKQIRSFLLDFPFLETTPPVHERAAGIFNQSKKVGLSVSTVDCLIAATAIHYHRPLLTVDSDFQRISQFSSLQLVAF